MTLSKSPLSYAYCGEVFNQALESERGIQVEFDTEAEAIYFAQKLNSYRTADRRKNMEIYEPGSPQYGWSAFDEIKVQRTKGEPVVRLIKMSAGALRITPLTET